MENKESDNSELFRTQFYEYFHSDIRSQEKLQELADSPHPRYVLNLDDLRKSKPELANQIISNPIQNVNILRDALRTSIKDLTSGDATKAKAKVFEKERPLAISIEGNFGKHHTTPRGLAAPLLHKLVCIQGIVTRCSLVNPKLMKSVHYCDSTESFSTRDYHDQYSLYTNPLALRGSGIPVKDALGNPLSTEYGYCQYKDYQSILLQEMPERTPVGQLPRSVEVILEGDLVDCMKPGDRMEVVGVYKTVTSTTSINTGVFRTILIATNIKKLTEIETPIFTNEELLNFKKLAEKPDVFDVLSKSIAPSIEGHAFIKQAILLQLLGGVEKTLPSGTHLRGDINLLLVGDPSTGKSQLLRQVMNLANLAIHTTGRGSSGVGLTAAVITDKDTGEKHLEAGAMVLGDKGIVCIDEFDKMNDIDRVAIHEVMEQQTVTIAKAGIYTSLNARCSVLAAANPIYGEYNKSIPPNRNIGLPDSLLSRFDLLFITLDDKNPESDRKVARRVLSNHTFKGEGESIMAQMMSDDVIIDPELKANTQKEDTIYEKNAQLYGAEKQDLITTSFIKKYIIFAKKNFAPTLNEDAVDFVSTFWTKMRPKEGTSNKTLPITVRTLETIIRLSTAHAKCRLSKTVTRLDCEVATKLLNYALFHEEIEDVKEEEEEKKDEKKSSKKKSQEESKMSTRRSQSKKMKTDVDQDLAELLQSKSTAQEQFAEEDKKYLYKILQEQTKNLSPKEVSLDKLWEVLEANKGSKTKIQTRKDMMDVLFSLEKSNVIMVSNKEKKVIII
jgi:DNA replication licensing factor MCM3